MRKRMISPFWLSLSILLSAVILALCVFAWRGGSLRLEPEGEAQDVVVRFFNAVVTGSYPEAYACLSDYSALGLENEPGSAAGRSLYQALRQSYGFTLEGPCETDRLEAVQRVQFRYLDVKAVETAVAARVESVAEALVAETPSAEIYDEQRQYLPSFTDAVYAEALRQVLENAADYYTSAELDVSLAYDGGSWKMKSSPALFSALLGNA